ncbi:tRNA (adenosine(37)-N6)-threonylcarbamoyltransferase complex transferase subunit TsaD [Patescibacteria group bacterium]|nr:tRNA (adenosine(37)-N6)-threonylcarbamoyltransferase complex transferase subunit TsaD [Patescibacteria group bacterium]
MKILGIETSCDETAAAVVEDGTKILSNVVASSAEMQAKFGGVIPEQAARQQVLSVLPVISEALSTVSEVRSSKLEEKSNIQHQNLASNLHLLSSNIDAIAVTVGPGLIGSLLVGVETAKTLSYLWKKPVIPVNHLVAHIYANWLTDSRPEFPALALVVSGGHTDLVLMKGHAAPATLARSAGGRGKIEWIGGTRDDAAGEAFDKSARLLGLPYPGGPAIAAAAANFQPPASHFQLNLLPRPMIDEDNFDFSFSGLKTAVLRETEKLENRGEKLDKEVRSWNKSKLQHLHPASSFPPLTSRLAAEIQEAIVDVLVKKTLDAVKKFKPKSLLLAGGVSANTRLRQVFELKVKSEKLKVDLRFPPANLCTDNAAYIASYAFFNNKPASLEKISANAEMTIVDSA